MNVIEKLKTIRTFIFDVDGVLTDSSLLVLENGDMLRTMNARDGYAIRHAINVGFQVIIITGGKSQGVVTRLKKLGVDKVYFGIEDKLSILDSLVKNNHIDLESTAYMGDDIPDIPVMEKVAVACCPHDADSEVLQKSIFVSAKKGGNGCVRDILEKTLRIQEKWL